jgi:very-short-patch-repair endonuclease
MFAEQEIRLAPLLEPRAAQAIQLIVTDDVADCLSSLSTTAEARTPETRLLVRVWDDLPSHRDMREEMLDCLARSAFAVWPNWYGNIDRNADGCPSLVADQLLHAAGVAAVRCEIIDSWLHQAVAHCIAGRLPRLRRFAPIEEASQLTLAVGPDRFFLALAVTNASEPNSGLFALARVCEWLASHARIRILLIIPRELANSPDLDSVSFAKVDVFVASEKQGQELHRDRLSRQSQGETTWEQVERGNAREWLAGSLIGRPHPYSRGEQMLWKAISEDPELSRLFECNQWVQTRIPTRYIADLVCRRFGLVVEVDGHFWHSGPTAFARDRQRDYELTVSDHLVLRLPHDEVVADVATAVDKIRSLVRFRQERDFEPQELPADSATSMI